MKDKNDVGDKCKLVSEMDKCASPDWCVKASRLVHFEHGTVLAELWFSELALGSVDGVIFE